MLKINDYKRGFGGQVVREYQCERILTLKGWLVLHTADLLKQARSLDFNPGNRRQHRNGACSRPNSGSNGIDDHQGGAEILFNRDILPRQTQGPFPC